MQLIAEGFCTQRFLRIFNDPAQMRVNRSRVGSGSLFVKEGILAFGVVISCLGEVTNTKLFRVARFLSGTTH